MASRISTSRHDEQIELLRGGSVVSSFAGAFGTDLRETRLTALLGYLIALEPDLFSRRFGFEGRPLSVSLETVHSKGRSDILMETTHGTGVVEAKVDTTDPYPQSKQYPADWRVLVTEHIPTVARRQRKRVRYFRWKEIAELLGKLTRSSNRKVSFVSRDLITHMEEHGMIREKDSVEVYARDVNDERTTTLFLQGAMYGCGYKEGSRLAKAAYFAPFFGRRMADLRTGLLEGMSYVARIEQVEVFESWRDFVGVTRGIRKGRWMKENRQLLKLFERGWWSWRQRISILYLGEPRLVFNPPIAKDNLQAGHGHLSKHFYSFDELFEAWGC